MSINLTALFADLMHVMFASELPLLVTTTGSPTWSSLDGASLEAGDDIGRTLFSRSLERGSEEKASFTQVALNTCLPSMSTVASYLPEMKSPKFMSSSGTSSSSSLRSATVTSSFGMLQSTLESFTPMIF